MSRNKKIMQALEFQDKKIHPNMDGFDISTRPNLNRRPSPWQSNVLCFLQQTSNVENQSFQS